MSITDTIKDAQKAAAPIAKAIAVRAIVICICVVVTSAIVSVTIVELARMCWGACP